MNNRFKNRVEEESRDLNYILIVDDSITTARTIQLILEKNRYKTEIAASVSEASNIIGHKNIGVVLIDYELAGINEGSVLIERIKKYRLNILTFAISGSDDSNETLRKSGCDGLLGKDIIAIKEKLDSLKNSI